MEVCQGHFGRRHEEKFAVFQAVHIGLKLRQLSRANHAIAPDEKRRTDFGVAVLAGVQVEHKIDQRPLEFRTSAGKTNESAPAQLRRTLEIENFQFLAERDMIERSAAEFRFGPPLSNQFIRARVFAGWHARVRQVRNFKKQIPLSGFTSGCEELLLFLVASTSKSRRFVDLRGHSEA